jgi:ubiquitin carboxyl-terminal hydrolase 14
MVIYTIKLLLNLIFFIYLDVGSNNNGFYQLNAVLTHKGRSSSSGHYVAWVRRNQSIKIL